LADVTRVLAQGGINIRAISIADTADFGILRLIVDNDTEALRLLNAAGFTTRETSVAAVEIDDTPGSLARVMEVFKESKVNIEYLYASLEGKTGKAVVIFKLENFEKGLRIIEEHGFSMIDRF
jgi:hypothetical protein